MFARNEVIVASQNLIEIGSICQLKFCIRSVPEALLLPDHERQGRVRPILVLHLDGIKIVDLSTVEVSIPYPRVVLELRYVIYHRTINANERGA